MLEPIILIQHAGWKKSPRNLEAVIRKTARAVAKHLPRKALPARAEVTVLLTDNRTIRQLNRDFRGLDRPTNVLSFPQFSPRQLARLQAPKKGKISLGDIALGYQYIVAEANKNHKILINHVTHMILHGILHLLGYNHLSQRTAQKMEQLETKIMATLGLPDPYQPVSRRPARSRSA